MNLQDVYAIRVPRTARKRVGRGWGSGVGKTSGRGEKGAGRRSGTRFRLRFEGGQMPLYRRLPKKGFSNHPFRLRFLDVNVGDLDRLFEAGTTVDLDALRAVHLAPKNARLWKCLGDGKLSKALTVKAHAASDQAKQKVAAAGGTLEVVEGKHLDRLRAVAERRAKTAKAREAAIAAARTEAEKAVAQYRSAKVEAEKKAKKGAKPAGKAAGASGAPKAEKPAKGEKKAEGGAPKGEKPPKPEGGAPQAPGA
jgi:large subunit ribosomal protein L15